MGGRTEPREALAGSTAEELYWMEELESTDKEHFWREEWGALLESISGGRYWPLLWTLLLS